MPSHIILHPRQRDGLRDVRPRRDGKDGKVAHADGDAGPDEEEDLADRRDEDAQDAEGVAVAEIVGGEGGEDRARRSADVDWDGADLGCCGGEAEFLDDCGDEELGFVSWGR